MADLYTSKWEEQIIDQVIHYGLGQSKAPKYVVFRMALAKSLRLNTPPDKTFDTNPTERGSEYRLNVITGWGKAADSSGAPQDFDDAVRALLSAYHEEDLFTDGAKYRTYLQRHIRRGLYEIGTTWKRGHDFTAFLLEELFAGLEQTETEKTTTDNTALEQGLTEIGIQAEIVGVTIGPRLDCYQLHLANLDHYDRLKRSLDKLALSMGMADEALSLRTTDQPKVIGLDIPRKPQHWHTVSAADLPHWAAQHKDHPGLPVWLGQDTLGQDFTFDLAEAPHLLIAGTTGSGKSVTLHALLASMLHTQTPETLQLALIDPKQTELNHYQTLPNLLRGKVVFQLAESAELLDELVAEMENRNTLLSQLGVRTLNEAVEKGHSMPRIVLVVEELADLLMQSRELETPLVRLAQKARAAGIHLVLATQRPDAATFSGLLRSNIPARIALRVQKASESRIILDQTGAEKLLGKGDMLITLPTFKQPERVHGAHMTQDDIRAAIRYWIS